MEADHEQQRVGTSSQREMTQATIRRVQHSASRMNEIHGMVPINMRIFSAHAIMGTGSWCLRYITIDSAMEKSRPVYPCNGSRKISSK